MLLQWNSQNHEHFDLILAGELPSEYSLSIIREKILDMQKKKTSKPQIDELHCTITVYSLLFSYLISFSLASQ